MKKEHFPAPSSLSGIHQRFITIDFTNTMQAQLRVRQNRRVSPNGLAIFATVIFVELVTQHRGGGMDWVHLPKRCWPVDDPLLDLRVTKILGLSGPILQERVRPRPIAKIELRVRPPSSFPTSAQARLRFRLDKPSLLPLLANLAHHVLNTFGAAPLYDPSQ